ncbi:hypothetical protein PPSIR1_06973 [Plesiocystis pacifica SIR-1]|uniref:NADH:quinone oxidoreductase/Mrp antiporter transmembrane domain-containing protein n=1 Tax=Plesiocystis pacifica SIR-1 TaxID=391625 RepID=A6G553_9BACT|nr:proton-conducting transporter membrane subunit [Plesiocystis pacifica]EDM78965.1 hypothetical protein PPSIR1_06973 [Plesiocystis pacifica SIR-1]
MTETLLALAPQLLTWAVLIPGLMAVLIAALPRSEPALVRGLGLVGALIEAVVLLALLFALQTTAPVEAAAEAANAAGAGAELVPELPSLAVSRAWIPGLGVRWSLALDGTAVPWLLLVALLFPLAIMTGGDPKPGEPPLIVGMLGLQSAWVTVLLAQDLVVLVGGWELGVVLAAVLIGERGDGRTGVPGRTRAARRYAAHALVGAGALLGAVALVGVGHAHATGGVLSWELAVLEQITLDANTQALGFGLVIVAVLVSLPLVPAHTWTVQLGVSGPTPVVAVMLGASTAMGLFLLQRVALPLFPLSAGVWAETLAGLAAIGAVYAAAVCWAEREPGRLLAHAALLHLALGVVAALSGNVAARVGLGPFVLAHGLGLITLTAVLHSLRRSGVGDLGELAGWAAVAPRAVSLGLLSILVLAGAPLSAGFFGELAIVVGVLRDGSLELLRPGLWTALAILALGVGTLGLLVRLWQASRGSPRPGLGDRVVDLSLRETLVGAAAMVLALVIGVAPGALIARTEPAEQEAVERLHLGRCLAIEARNSPRPRVRDEFESVCLDPGARILQFYGRATAAADAHAGGHHDD